MSKLLKLKEWVTIEDAAKHLSIMFGEDVTSADVLRLALDGELTLSVNFVNGADARRGALVSMQQVKFAKFPKDMKAANQAKAPGDYKGGYQKIPLGVPLDDGNFIELSDEIVSLWGVLDLPMIGCERLDIEHLYQKMTAGPSVTLQGLDGSFVIDQDGIYYQLQEDYDDNEYVIGSRAQGRMLEARIEREELDTETIEKLRGIYKQERELFKNRRLSKAPKENCYPAGGLPKDAVLVVRTDALAELRSKSEQSDRGDRQEGELQTRERDTLLKLVIGMAMAEYGYAPEASRNSAVSEIASDITKLGMSITDDTVRKWLKEAEKSVLPAKVKLKP